MRGPIATFPLVVVRHGSAGERGSFDGPDRKRPLDDKGARQAAGLAELLDLFGDRAGRVRRRRALPR